MSILQIGVPTTTFVVDAIALNEQIPLLAPFLSDRNIQKIVWDGRLGYSELWHRYEIRLQNVLDLQLMYLHDRYDVSIQKCVPLSGKLTAIKEKKLLSPAVVEIELKSPPSLGLELISERFALSKDKWSDRPLPATHLEYAAAQMSHLRMLAAILVPQAGKSANILRESKRYIELWHRQRRNTKSPYQIPNYLPQGIIERTENERSNRTLGARRCRGCVRELYQESFQLELRRWAYSLEKQYCYTCAKVNLRLYRRTRFLDVLELAKSRTASPALIMTETKV